MTTRVEAGTTLEGSIRSEGSVEIAGRVRGVIDAGGTVTVAPGGIVEADVRAARVEVMGLLTGSVTAMLGVSVASEGRLEALVRTPRLVLAPGAAFRGDTLALGAGEEAPVVERLGALPAPERAAESPRETSAPRESPSIPAPSGPTRLPRGRTALVRRGA